MTNWTDGYVADIGYTYGYYGELNPLRTQLAFINNGIEFPSIKNACELGFGQGVSVNIHAAGNSSTAWYGTDFNPSQAGFARSLSAATGAQAYLFDQSFDEFCTRSDLPQFEYIGIHGIWSWISDENRQIIVNFLRDKLAVGGIIYISYNTLPGWSTAAPLRHLMTQHANSMTGTGQGILGQINDALNFTQQLLDTAPIYSKANPSVPERFGRIKTQNASYLAHEYFNRDWHPMYYSDMAEWLKPAKLSFACSAHYLDYVNEVNFTGEQQKLLADIPDADFKQTVRDFVVNQQFRKDYWIKGPRRIDPLRQAELIRAVRVLLTTPRADVPMKFEGALGEASLNEPIYGPILDALADHRIKTIGELEAIVRSKEINLAQLTQAIIVLAGAGHISAAQDESVIKSSLKATQRFNQDMMIRSRSSADMAYMASPVTGGGFTVTRFQQLFLLSILHNRKRPQDWATFVWDIIAAQGQAILKDGKPLATPQENISELNELAEVFANKQLPILKALQIA